MPRLLLPLAIACFFGSGFLSLVYEICWIRKASLVFGAASFAMSTVIGVFFAGLAIGSYLSGRYSRLVPHPLVGYAIIELAVGIAAIISPAAFVGADRVFGWCYPAIFDHFWAVCGVRLALVAAILLPPSVLIGGTLPLFCRGFVRNADCVQRNVGLLYGVNTIGAALGCATCGFVLLPKLGANATLYYGGICNLAIAGIAWSAAQWSSDFRYGCREAVKHSSEERACEASRKVTGDYTFAVLFFLTGFVALGHEIVWARFLSLLMYNTVYTYTLTLTVILFGIVIGSMLAATPLLRTGRPAAILGCVHVAIAVTVLVTLFLPVQFWQSWRNPESIAWQLGLVVFIMLPSAILSGIAFPLAARLVTHQTDEIAATVGWLTAINTFGGLAGSLLIGFGSLPAFGLHSTVLLTTAASVFGGLVTWWWVERQMSRRTKFSLSAIACGLWLLIPLASDTRLPADFLATADKLVEFREGLTGHIAVVRDQDCLRLEVDRLWQGENRHTHQVVAAHLPMMLHDHATRILVIGLGPGQTASRFLMYPVERLDCVEIERELLSLLPRYFRGTWLNDPRVRCIVEDGRNFVRHTDQYYDVISIEVGQAFRPGVAAFYTHDFYEHARERLRYGGLVTQFVSLEFFNCDELRSVIRTFGEVFPECALFHNRTELLLVGKRDGKLTLTPNRLQVLAANELIRRDLDFGYWGSARDRLSDPDVFAANFLAGKVALGRFAAGARIARDTVPWLEFSTSCHRTPDISAAKTELQGHLSPVGELMDSAGPQQQHKIAAIRQRNLDNLLSEEYIWQARQTLRNAYTAEAVVLLRKALHWNADHLGARVLLGDVLASQGKYSAAVEEYRDALTGHPELRFIEARIRALEMLKQPQKAATRPILDQ